MDRMTELQQAVTVGAAVLATILTRFLPYILLPAGKETPAFVRYLGSYLDPQYSDCWWFTVSGMSHFLQAGPSEFRRRLRLQL